MRRLSTLLWLTFSLGGLYACSGDANTPSTSTAGSSSGTGSSSASGAGGAGATTTTTTASGASTSTSTSTSGAGGGGGAGGGAAATCPTAAVKCSDQSIQELNLQTDIAKGLITNEADGAGWISTFDATAGGSMNPDPDSYTYGIFTDNGITKVMISDQSSLDSAAWDIGFRRFIGRINSGSSGPSCVKAALVGKIADWDTLTTVPPDAPLADDLYFDDTCTIKAASQGLGSPETALAYFWEYPIGCVKMTGNVYVLQLADGRHVKLSVLAFYNPDVQALCDTDQKIPTSNTGSAHIRVRWAFLP